MLPSHYIKIHDYGFVGLVDHMGSDAAIVEAARVSYQTGTKATRTDRALIRYLMRHKHTSPLEMCEVKLHIRAPIFVLRQWLRRTPESDAVARAIAPMMEGASLLPPPVHIHPP